MFQGIQSLFSFSDYGGTYRSSRDSYLKAASGLKLSTGPNKAARDALVAGAATYTRSMFE